MTTAELAAALARSDRVEGADLTAVDWRDFSAEGAQFSRCSFGATRLSHAALAEAQFDDCHFTAAGDPAAGCTFAFCTLRAAEFRNCDLSLACFERCDLFDMAMDRCRLRGARFIKPDFSHAYSRKLVTTRAAFRACNFALADLSAASLPGCDLTASRFREADLTGADLSGAVLRDCDLFQAVLTGAKLDGADLRGAEVSGLSLTGLASFAGMRVGAGQQFALLEGLGVVVGE